LDRELGKVDLTVEAEVVVTAAQKQQSVVSLPPTNMSGSNEHIAN
jgi:hypothetical protein